MNNNDSEVLSFASKTICDSHRVVMVGSKEYRYECQPDDASGVHGEPDVLGLVEIGGDLPGLDGVHSAQEDQDHVIHQGQDQGEGGHAARLNSAEIHTYMV